MLRILFALLAVFSTLSLSAPASAQEQNRAILVLDASGSMWGQIDGVAKITIAQEVIGGLLQSLPEDQLLGLTVYGARRKGDCSDIETLLEPTTDRQAIADLVNRIKPRGKTPMTDAVVDAARALRFTEEKATVILISDGLETCNPNPCAMARALEESGVDFTAHVIGFAVSDEVALTQMKCLAEETGGLFRTASNADELAQALQEVAEPEPVEVTFRAIEGEGGPEITEGLLWTLGTDAAGIVFENEANPALTRTMLPGSGRIEVMRLEDEAHAEAMFTVDEEDMLVTLVLPKLLPQATIIAPDEALAGSMIPVQWSGPVTSSTVIALADPDQPNGAQHGLFYLDQETGNSGQIMAPVTPGLYELRYMTRPDGAGDVLARHQIRVTPFDFAISAPETGRTGTELPVEWVVPDPARFVISLARPTDASDRHVDYFYATSFADGRGQFTLPAMPGTYEVRLLDSFETANIVARQLVEVTEETASLDAPAEVEIGQRFEVTWEGPNKQISGRGDYLAVAGPDMPANQELSYVYTSDSDANRAGMIAPVRPGTYELRYILNGPEKRILARREISVVPVGAALSFDGPAEAGATLAVTWQGPARNISGRGDYIAIAEPGMRPNQEVTYSYVTDSDGNVAVLEVPTTPGTYELRYILNGPENLVLAAEPLEVVPVMARLSHAGPARAGGKLLVTWEGPGGTNDYLAIAEPGMRITDEVTYRYVKNSDGNVLEMNLPTTPGTYELRYIQRGTEKKILAVAPLVVEPVSASLEFTSPAKAGATLAVTWEGPGGNDYLAIAEPGMGVNQEATYRYVKNSDGNVLEIDLPTTPGTYEVRYIQRGNEKKILAAAPLVVEPVSASLEFASPAKIGSALMVTWDGPGGADYIAIAEPGMAVNDEVTYAYVRNSEGNTLRIEVPTTPGAYEVRYIQKGNEKKILAAAPLVVEPVSASLTFRNDAPAGGTLVVTWQGPGRDSFANTDYIAVAMPGSKPGDEETYAYVKNGEGNVVEITLPDTPGTYELRYLLNAGQDKVLAAEPLNVVPLRATLEAPATAAPGDQVPVTWSGPGYYRDTIIIARPGSDSAESFASTAGGETVTLYAPMVKGAYEIRYLYAPLNQVVATIPLVVE